MKSKQPDPAPRYQSPGLLRIAASMVYDSLLLAAVSIAYGAVVVGLRVVIQGQPEPGHRIQWGFVSGSLVSLGWLAMLVLFQMLDAQTYQRASYKQCITRSFAAILSVVLLGFGYWCKFFHPQKKMLHDMLSGTTLILLKN